MSVVAGYSGREYGAGGRDGDRSGYGFEPLQVAKLHALESGIQVD